MDKINRSKVDLTESLSEQLELLKIFCKNFDDGQEIIGKHIAVTLRLLLHDTKNSKSLLGQLDLLKQAFYDTAGPINTRNLMFMCGLVTHAITRQDGQINAMYTSAAQDGEYTKAPQKIPFESWWEDPVLLEQARGEKTERSTFSRKRLILEIADTDGGAHVDPSLFEDYVSLAKRDRSEFIFDIENPDKPIENQLELVCMRQIGEEVLLTLDEQYASTKEKVLVGGNITRRNDKNRKTESRVDDSKIAALALRRIGSLSFATNIRQSLKAYLKSTILDPNSPDGWNMLGHLYWRRGNSDKAIETYYKVVEIGESTQNQYWVAIGNGDLGNIHASIGSWNKAEQYYLRSLSEYEALNHEDGIATQYCNLGSLFKNRGNLEEAELYTTKSIEMFKALNNKNGIANSYGNLGNICQYKMELEQAEQHYLASLAIFESLGYTDGIANQHRNIGLNYKLRGKQVEARQSFETSLTIYQELGSPEVERLRELLENLSS